MASSHQYGTTIDRKTCLWEQLILFTDKDKRIKVKRTDKINNVDVGEVLSVCSAVGDLDHAVTCYQKQGHYQKAKAIE